MRYDDRGYLEAWRDAGQYPIIHLPLFTMLVELAKGFEASGECCARSPKECPRSNVSPPA